VDGVADKKYNYGGITMPGLDRSGPEGAGAKTGRGQGLCNPNTRADATAFGQGRGGRGRRGCGIGQGRGRGPGRGFGYTDFQNTRPQAAPATEETSGLKAQVEQLQAMLAQMQDRLDGLQK